MKVMNIGIIIRNNYNDTFPVALTPQMVGVIQNLLVQIPVLKSAGLVDPSGNKVTANPSIPIIPRNISFDWEAAYSPMTPDQEKAEMEALHQKYKILDESEGLAEANTDSEGKVIALDAKKQIGEDPLNPFNLSLNASGRNNTDSPEEENSEQQDCNITPDSLGLGTDTPELGK